VLPAPRRRTRCSEREVSTAVFCSAAVRESMPWRAWRPAASVVGRNVLISESAGEWEWSASLSGRETPWMTTRSGT
jgi:hypothetical protein